jgi:helix-turn-helix protein
MSSKKKTRLPPRSVRFREAEDGTRPALESLNTMPREAREALYAIVVAVRDGPSLAALTARWGLTGGRATVDTRGIYEARETHAGSVFRLFCVLETVPDGEQELVILSGVARPAGEELLPVSALRRIRAEAAPYLGKSERPDRQGNPVFELALARELEDPYFRAGFERKLATIKATNELVSTLERARRKKRLTKAEVARRVNRRPEAVSRLLAGKDQHPTLDAIADLAYALGLEIELRITKRSRRTRDAAAR